jgi:curli biogenesis system outer membrane secretion channel CsgG
MKKLILIISALVLVATLTACSSKTVATGTTETAAKAAQSIDVDLTQMSSTMIYSEVQNMMLKPADYVGKTVRMQGAFSVSEIGENRYFACIIKDATACCAQGIEFDWAGDHSYPADYPKDGSDITVTGEFTTYNEGQQQYCQLKNAELKF